MSLEGRGNAAGFQTWGAVHLAACQAFPSLHCVLNSVPRFLMSSYTWNSRQGGELTPFSPIFLYRMCPIFQISNVTGENLDLLKMFLNLLSPRTSYREEEPAEFQIDDTYSVPVRGLVFGRVFCSLFQVEEGIFPREGSSGALLLAWLSNPNYYFFFLQ